MESGIIIVIDKLTTCEPHMRTYMHKRKILDILTTLAASTGKYVKRLIVRLRTQGQSLRKGHIFGAPHKPENSP